MKTALVIVDLQNDFVSGTLAVHSAEELIPVIDDLVKRPFDLVIATKDWHPSNHSSFAVNHPGKQVGETISLAGSQQILWPVHCVQGTSGAEFAPGWDASQVDRIFLKGIDPLIDSYSTLFDNLKQRKTGLDDYLKGEGVEVVFFVGLATDYCVKFSALDALELGYKVYVVADACRGIELNQGDVYRALSEIRGHGGQIIGVSEIEKKMKQL